MAAAQWAEEKRLAAAYRERTSRPWLVPRGVRTRAAADLPMRLPVAVGEVRTVCTVEPRTRREERRGGGGSDDEAGGENGEEPRGCSHASSLTMIALSTRPVVW